MVTGAYKVLYSNCCFVLASFSSGKCFYYVSFLFVCFVVVVFLVVVFVCLYGFCFLLFDFV